MFKVRNNKTRKWCEGDFCLTENGELFTTKQSKALQDGWIFFDDITDTHTACFPVGDGIVDKHGEAIYEGDKLNSEANPDHLCLAKMGGLLFPFASDCGYIAWENLEKDCFTIIPPKLTWPELDDGTFFKFDDDTNNRLLYVKVGDKVLDVNYGTWYTSSKTAKVTVLVPDWKEEKA